ncbi:hypothetical protein ACS0TY_025170 [Phlomoides rotata]
MDRILKTPVSPIGYVDAYVWHFERNGTYFAKSGYKLVERLVSDGEEVVRVGWNRLWGLKVPPRVKACLWRICKGFVLSKPELFRRHLLEERSCTHCAADIETSWHIFMNCQFARDCWLCSTVAVDVENVAYEAVSTTDFMLRALEQLDGAKAVEFAMIIWRMWNDRNNRVWAGGLTVPRVAVSLARKYHSDWVESRGLLVPSQRLRPVCGAWHRPPMGYLKLNVDGAFYTDTREMGFGLVSHSARLYSSDEGEAIGLFEALNWIKDLGLKDVVIEMDAKLVVDAFNVVHGDSISVFEDIIDACKCIFKSHPFCKVVWVGRQANFIAHHLAKVARNFPSPFIWDELPFDVEGLPYTSCSC